MAKYRVKKRAQLLYPDGSVRGEAGYIVDASAPYDRAILADQGDALEPVRERRAVASPANLTKLEEPAPQEEPAKKKVAKKKAKKKTKKKASKRG